MSISKKGSVLKLGKIEVFSNFLAMLFYWWNLFFLEDFFDDETLNMWQITDFL